MSVDLPSRGNANRVSFLSVVVIGKIGNLAHRVTNRLQLGTQSFPASNSTYSGHKMKVFIIGPVS